MQHSLLVQMLLSPDLLAWMLTVNLHTLEKEQLGKWCSYLILFMTKPATDTAYDEEQGWTQNEHNDR